MTVEWGSRRLLAAAIAGTVCLGAAACGSSSKAGAGGSSPASASTGSGLAKSPFVIGNVGTYTGPLSTTFGGGNVAVDAWAKSVNASGGINGHPIKLILMDDKGDPATALADMHQLVQDGVLAIVGAASAADAEWASYVEQAKLPVITGLQGSADYTNNPSLFLISTGGLGANWAEAHLAKAVGGTKAGIVICSEVPACKAVPNLIKPYLVTEGVALTLVQAVSATQPDYTAACLAAKQAGVDVIDMVTVEATWSRFAQSCASVNYHPHWVLPGGYDASLLKVAEFDGAALMQTDFPGFVDTPTVTSNPAVAQYLRALATYAPGVKPTQLGESGSAAWVSAKLFEVVARNLPGNPTSADVFAGLYALHNETLGGISPGPLNFPAGQPRPPINCAWALTIGNGTLSAPNGLTPICMPAS